MTGLTLGVAAALCWAALDVVRKSIVRYASPLAVAVALSVGQLPFFLVWALADGTWVTTERYWLPALISVAANAMASVLFMVAVKLSPLSRTVPFLSLSPVFSAIIAIPTLGETPEPTHWLGIGLVVTGAFVLNSDLSSSVRRGLIEERGAPLMVAVALLWASSTAFDKLALPHSSAAAHTFILSAGVSVLLLTWIGALGRLGELHALRAAPAGLQLGLLGFAVAALATQMLALKWLWVAAVETLKRGLGVAASVLFGRVLFHEAVTPAKLAAAVLMISGTVLLVLS
jgi:drug/metabolite transporter (DMT)-like permease